LAFVTSRGSDAPPLLLQAARRLGPIDAQLSRATYLDAMSAAMFAGRLAVSGGVTEVSDAVGPAVRGLATPLASDLLLEGLATRFNEGYAAALPILRKALTAFGNDLPAAQELHWFWLACIAATHVWDDARWQELSANHIEAARNVGALSELPLALSSRALMLLFAGEIAEAGSLIEEIRTVADATGSYFASYAVLALAAFRGNQAEVATLIETTLGDVTRRGEGMGITVAEWSNAVLNNGLGRHEEAMDAAMRAAEFPADLSVATWALVESSRRPHTAACVGKRSTPTGGWSRRPMRVAPTGRWARVPAAPRNSPMATPPTPCTGNRSSGSAEPAFASSWRGRTCCTASGCATSNDEVRHARICTRPSACSMPWAWTPSPNGRGSNCGALAMRPAPAPPLPVPAAR
jgi:tetratricopeptide (TPR) repeat protein